MKQLSMTSASWADISPRVITSLIGAPLIMTAIVLGTPFFDVMICLFGAVAALELYEILRPQIPFGRGYVFGLLAVVMGFCAYCAPYLHLGIIVLVGLAVIFTGVKLLSPDAPDLRWRRDTIYPLLAASYVGVPLALLIILRNLPGGMLWLVALTFTVWATDTMALFGGRLFGQHKLAPQISPSKTIEGALTGILFGIGLGMSILVVGGTPVLMAVLLSAAASGMAVLGDLFESLVKRLFEVKDSSGLLPGHGGMLDRLDSMIAAAPVFYLLLLAFGGIWG